MVNFMRPSFSVGVGTADYRSGYERTFGPKKRNRSTPATCPSKRTLPNRTIRRCSRDRGHRGRHKDAMGMTWSSSARKEG